ncbi:STAS domain-containing protein [Streptomyces sp. NPDC001889]
MTVPPPLRHRTALVTDPATGTETALVELEGEADLAAEPQLHQLIGLCLTLHPHKIIIDLTRLALLDSAGLRALKTAAAQAGASGVGVVLAGYPPPLVQRLLDLTGTPLGPLHPPPLLPPSPVRPATGPAARRLPAAVHRAMTAFASATILASLLTGG